MGFNLTNLLQNFYSAVGETPPNTGIFAATGGSATTFINTNWQYLESPPETDIFRDMYVFVVTDATVATGEAALEGKYTKISAYADATYTGTMATMTELVAVNDLLMIAKQDKFPLAQVIFCANRALENLGDIAGAVDTSITTAANQTEYELPVACKRGLRQIYYQGITNDSNDNRWIPVFDRRNEPSAAGSVGTLFLPQLPSGRTVRLVYDGAHPKLSIYTSAINDAIHPEVATCATILEVLAWYNHQAGQGSDEYMLWLENQYRDKYLPQALINHPIVRPPAFPHYFVAGDHEVKDRPPTPILQ